MGLHALRAAGGLDGVGACQLILVCEYKRKKRTREDFSQAAARIVREAMERD